MNSRKLFRNGLITFVIILSLVLFLLPTSAFSQEIEESQDLSDGWVSSIWFESKEYYGLAGSEKTTKITAIYSADIVNPEITWSCDDDSIVEITKDPDDPDSANLKALSKGTTNIYASLSNGLKATAKYTVGGPTESITLNPESYHANSGDLFKPVPTILPANGCQGIIWSSSDESVAYVDEFGEVFTASAGTAIITATTYDGNKATCTIYVDSNTDGVTSIWLNCEDYMVVGESQQAKGEILFPWGATSTFTWETSDPNVLTVDENGKISAVGAGKATITCTAVNGGAIDTRIITVSEAAAESIQFEPSEIWVILDDNGPYDLKASVLPSNANQKIYWTGNKDGDVQVNENIDGEGYYINGLKLGTFDVLAKTVNGKEATLTVHVCSPTESLTLNPTSKDLQVGEEVTLEAAVKPDTACQNLTWLSSDDKVATVKDGKVTAVSAGTASITATSLDGKTATCKVTVTGSSVSVTSVSISKTTLTLTTGGSETLGAKVYPLDADPGIVWSSSDESIASVNDGVVMAKKVGTATITATSADGKAKATCKVTVKDASSQVQTVIVYRLYNPCTGEHLYTTDAHEKDVLYQKHGWGYEGIGWYAPSTGEKVYRLYQPGLDNHLYTTDVNEVNVLTSKYGWMKDNNGEAIFYSGGTVGIHRVYNPNLSGMHHMTTDVNEYNTLPKFGWKQEGLKLYAQALGSPTKTTQYYKK